MRKMLNQSDLFERSHERPTKRALLALTLTASLAAFGCTTNRNPGNGEPVTTPGVGPTTPSSSSTPGTTGSTSNMPAPMTSSYTGHDALPRVNAVSRADAAAAIMATHQAVQGRVLGPSNPGSGGRAYVSDGATGGYRNPAMLTNPQVTVNSSISSGPNPAVASGVGGGSTAVVNGAVVAASVNGTSGLTSSVGDVANATILSNTSAGGAAVFPAGGHPITPTNAALPLTPGAFAAGTSGSAVALASGATLGVVNALATPLGTPSPAQTVTVTEASANAPAPLSTNITSSAVSAANARVSRARTGATAKESTASSSSTSAGSVRTLRSNGRVVITNQ